MIREELRTKLLAGADKIRSISFLWNRMSHEEQSLSLAGRAFWAADNAVTNAALDAFLLLLPTRHMAMPKPSNFLWLLRNAPGIAWGVLLAWIGGMLAEKKR